MDNQKYLDIEVDPADYDFIHDLVNDKYGINLSFQPGLSVNNPYQVVFRLFAPVDKEWKDILFYYLSGAIDTCRKLGE